MVMEGMSNEDIVLYLITLIYGEGVYNASIVANVYEPVVNIELNGSDKIVTFVLLYTFYGDDGTEIFSNMITVLIDINGNVEKQYLLEMFDTIMVKTKEGIKNILNANDLDDIDLMLALSDKCEYTCSLEDLISSINNRLNILYNGFVLCNIGYYNTIRNLLLMLDADKFVEM